MEFEEAKNYVKDAWNPSIIHYEIKEVNKEAIKVFNDDNYVKEEES